jgi:hypothetical protein
MPIIAGHAGVDPDERDEAVAVMRDPHPLPHPSLN